MALVQWDRGGAPHAYLSIPRGDSLFLIEASADQEVEALQHEFGFPRIVYFPALAIVAWLLGRAVQMLAHFGSRLRSRRRRLVAAFATLLTGLVWGWAVALALGRLLRAAPVISLVALALAVVLVVVALSKHVENVAAGLGLVVRGRIDEGDQVRVGELTGMVERVGLTRVQLRGPTGDTIYVPNRTFTVAAVTIGRARHSFPLRVQIGRQRAFGSDEVERARQIAMLSPYRDPKARVGVRPEGTDATVLAVEIQVWAERLVPFAEQHLRRMLDRHVINARGKRRSL